MKGISIESQREIALQALLKRWHKYHPGTMPGNDPANRYPADQNIIDLYHAILKQR